MRRSSLAFLMVGVSLVAGQDNTLNIPDRCLSKLPSVGSATYSESTVFFDHYSFIEDDLTQDAFLHEYDACVNAQGQLTSLQLTYFDMGLQEKIALERAGPRLLGCNKSLFESRGNLDMLRIYFEDEKITGIVVGYYSGFIVQRIGVESAQFKDYEFGNNLELMGFYGIATETGISQLGPIIQDAYCTRAIMRLREEAKRKIKLDRAKLAQMDLIDDYYFMILCGVASLLMATILTICCLKFVCRCFDIVDEVQDKREEYKETAEKKAIKDAIRRKQISTISNKAIAQQKEKLRKRSKIKIVIPRFGLFQAEQPTTNQSQQQPADEAAYQPDERIDTAAPMNHYMETEGPDYVANDMV